MDSDFLDELDFGFSVAVPFSNTAQFPGHCFLDNALEKGEEPRDLLEPMNPESIMDIDSDSSDSSEDEEYIPKKFYDSVGPGFGPGGGDIQLDFKVYKNEATNPALSELIIASEHGDELFRVRPKFQPRQRIITRGCVETAISEWMKRQRMLPFSRYEVQSDVRTVRIDGEEKRVAVWLWRGLEQDRTNPNRFKIFL